MDICPKKVGLFMPSYERNQASKLGQPKAAKPFSSEQVILYEQYKKAKEE